MDEIKFKKRMSFYIKGENSMKTEIVSFIATDGMVNNGYIQSTETPIDKNKKIMISIHGMTSNCFKERDKTIGKMLLNIDIDYFSFNNRGSEILRIAKKRNGQEVQSVLTGTAIEKPTDGIYDIEGAIEEVVKRGYRNIYLLGHSLGSTKVVYTMARFKMEKFKYLEYIRGIALLSLVDIPNFMKEGLKEKLSKKIEYAEKLIEKGDGMTFMPGDSFIFPITAKAFLYYARDNKEFDFARYSDKEYDFNELNMIEVPLFMRWGTDRELLIEKPEEIVERLNSKITNTRKDINFIEGANHSYNGMESVVGDQLIDFIKRNN